MKEYKKGDLVIQWQPKLCQHSGICVRTLPNAYKPKEKPWIDPDGASKEEFINQINRCPSGALSYRLEN